MRIVCSIIIFEGSPALPLFHGLVVYGEVRRLKTILFVWSWVTSIENLKYWRQLEWGAVQLIFCWGDVGNGIIPEMTKHFPIWKLCRSNIGQTKIETPKWRKYIFLVFTNQSSTLTNQFRFENFWNRLIPEMKKAKTMTSRKASI